MRILNPEKISCYIVDKFLGDYLIREKKLSLLMVMDKKYYFAKNEISSNAINNIPIIYKFCDIETKGGE
jgi:hypothetical protein